MIKTKAIYIRKNSSAKQLKIEDGDELKLPTGKEMIIQVKYSGINFADIMMRLGLYQDAPPKPYIPGYEVSGVVTHIGAEVKDFQVGDQVLAGTKFGGYSSHVKVLPYQVIKIPSHLSLEEAAALPVNFITSYLCLDEIGRLRRGDRVVIDCATGGVGSIALQILRHLEIETIGLTGNSSKFPAIEKYGAKAMTREEFEKSPVKKEYKFILNSSGSKKEVKDQLSRLQLGGHLLCLGLSSAISDGKKSIPKLIKTLLTVPKLSLFDFMLGNITMSGLNALTYFDDHKWVEKSMVKMKEYDFLKPNIHQSFPAANISEAHRELETGKATGKVLLKWS
ncbi:alcohol dehydrogenase catalytic domain-containing protein [Bacteriovoracaceae bacterium]|nr:alcohol dehydrogenase catalytic domain-containing protein [Bacteriovoracaceae bacterium]